MPGPIEHLIVLMLENRSFDHFLGALPNVNGVDPANPNRNFVAPGSATSYAQHQDAVRKMKPDPSHETEDVLTQIKGDRMGPMGESIPMGAFVYDFAVKHPNNQDVWPQVMSYFPLNGLGALHQLAQSFCVCDQWFSSVPGPTWTNRFFTHSGTSQGWVKMPELPFHANFHKYDQTTIFDRLNEKNVPWRIYAGDIPQSLLLYNQRKKENLKNYRRMSDFFKDVAQKDAAAFPNYVFIEPAYLPFGQNDQHPPHDVLKGDDLIATVYNALRSRKDLWDSSLLLIVWDEHGGFYDHVPPPAAQQPDHNTQEGFDFKRYGVRVPAILVSKWVTPGSVFAPAFKTLDHTSILRYLTDQYGLGPLGARTDAAASFAPAIGEIANQHAPDRVGTGPRPAIMAEVGEEIAPTFNKNQAALIEFSRQLELEIGGSPAEIGLRTMRAAASPQGEVETAKERVWLFIDGGSK